MTIVVNCKEFYSATQLVSLYWCKLMVVLENDIIKDDIKLCLVLVYLENLLFLG